MFNCLVAVKHQTKSQIKQLESTKGLGNHWQYQKIAAPIELFIKLISLFYLTNAI